MNVCSRPLGSVARKSGAPMKYGFQTALALALLGSASSAQFGNFTYTDTGSAITITAYTSTSSGPVSIPATIAGKPVTEIGNDAFKAKTGITAVTFPANMAKIGQGAFQGCTGLGNVTLPSGIQRIETSLFSGCVSLKSVTLPAGVTSIGFYAFYECKLLSAVNIPDGVTLIDSLAFSGCEALQSLSLPASLSALGTSALAGGGFRSISVAAGNAYFSSSNGVLYNKSQSTLVRYPPNKADSSHVIQAGVTRIEGDAFQGSQYLKNLTLPAGLTDIGGSAFGSCTSLTGINIPQGITTIPDGAFYRCTSLPAITLPSGVKTIGHFAFQECSSLAVLTLPEGLETIAEAAFETCGLTEIHLPASVTSIGLVPFEACDKLNSITVDAGNPIFSSVDGVLFNKSRTTLRKYPAARLGRYQIPYGVTSIGQSSFEGADALTEIIIPSTVTTIDGDAFNDCDSLTRLTIPSSLDYLGPRAFDSCDSLAQAIFLGNAPTISLGPFSFAAPDFSVGYYNNRTGFSSPTWQGYPSVNLGDWADVPQDLKVEDSAAGELVNGGAVPGIGSASIGGSSVVTLTLTNTGTVDLTNIAISISGADAGDFQVSALGSDYLTGGESLTFQITFAPTAIGIRSATLLIASSDADENPFELTLSGTGTAPEISIEQPAGTAIQDGGNRDFGAQVLGMSKPLVFTVNNTGTGDLTGLATSITGIHASDFTVSSAPTSPVATGGSTTFTVAFKPSGTGNRGAVLHVANNDPDESPYDINLTGKGVALPEITIEQPAGSGLVDGVSKKSFGTVTVGKVGKTRKFIIKNSGTAKLTGLGLTRTGKHKKDFVISTLSKSSLLPGESTSFQAAFKPAAKGTRTAAIHVLSNDADESPFDITVTGAGAVK